MGTPQNGSSAHAILGSNDSTPHPGLYPRFEPEHEHEPPPPAGIGLQAQGGSSTGAQDRVGYGCAACSADVRLSSGGQGTLPEPRASEPAGNTWVWTPAASPASTRLLSSTPRPRERACTRCGAGSLHAGERRQVLHPDQSLSHPGKPRALNRGAALAGRGADPRRAPVLCRSWMMPSPCTASQTSRSEPQGFRASGGILFKELFISCAFRL